MLTSAGAMLGNLPLIYDADSSQHSALIDVMDGKNRGIEGPPGTGKSQTITNLSQSLQKLEAVANVIQSAPRDLLHMSHSGLRRATAVTALESSIEQLRANQRLHEELSPKFYLDVVPADNLLAEAIITLREGDAWYRIFQKRWRSAVRTHRQLQPSKEKRSAQERQRELEQVRQLVTNQRRWREDLELRTTAGPHFKDEQTPLDSLLTVARWVQTSDASLEEVQVSVVAFDPVLLDRQTLTALSVEAAAISSALNTLCAFEQANALRVSLPTVRS